MKLRQTLIALTIISATSLVAQEMEQPAAVQPAQEPAQAEPAIVFEPTPEPVVEPMVQTSASVLPSAKTEDAAPKDEDAADLKLPEFYGYAYEAGMAGNVMAGDGPSTFLMLPHRIAGKEFILISNNDSADFQGMLSIDAFGGTIFAYGTQKTPDATKNTLGGNFHVGYATSKFGAGLYTSLNRAYTKDTDKKSTTTVPPAVTDDTSRETTTPSNQLYGLFGSFDMGMLELYGGLEYFQINTQEDINQISTTTTTTNNDITRIGAYVGTFIGSGAHGVDIKATVLIKNDETKVQTKITGTTPSNTTVTTKGDNHSVYALDANYGLLAKSAGDINVYLGAATNLTIKSVVEADKAAGSSEGKVDFEFGITPSVSTEYALSQNFLMFGSIAHVIKRTSESEDTIGDFDATAAVNYQVDKTHEKTDLSNHDTTGKLGIRWNYHRLSIESNLERNVFKDGVSSVFKGSGLHTETTVILTF
ncbi:MAG: hypothetical protein OCD01_03055 [Fibrobacterales bacterium]